MVLYAESSAVLAWLLGEPTQDDIIEALAAADDVVTSALTGVECARGLQRARVARRITAAQEASALRFLDDALAGWHLLDLTGDVLDVLRSAFPHEPVRTLDALHIASAVVLHRELGELGVLSLDDRVRTNARELRMRVLPAR